MTPAVAPGVPVARATHATVHAAALAQPEGYVMTRCGNVVMPFHAKRLLGARCPLCFPEEVAFVCERGHRTPYAGGPLEVISCPFRVAARTWCSRPATLRRPAA
jgi:hypothetical protein